MLGLYENSENRFTKQHKLPREITTTGVNRKTVLLAHHFSVSMFVKLSQIPNKFITFDIRFL